MRKHLLAVFTFIIVAGHAQEGKKSKLDAGNSAKLFIAKQKYFGGSFAGALAMFKDIEKDDPQDDVAKYYIGACYYALGQYDNCRESLLKGQEVAKGKNTKINYLLGKIYQRSGEIDKAIEHYQMHNASDKAASAEKEEVTVFLAQCDVAKKLMSEPLNVNISNLGAEINSRFDDKNPCVTADDQRLVFTTRRPENPDSPIDVEGDGKHFENIYMCRKDSSTMQFGKATIMEKSINTPAHDACTSISPDGKQLFIYKNDIDNKASRGGNVFVSKQLNGKWKKPESLGKPINTGPNWEGGACVSPDGKRYFFTSERPGGFGGSDIWMVERLSKKKWGEPVNMGAKINSSFDEAGMFLAPDGKTLFFCSNGPKSMGGYDVFRTVFENGQWSEPVNLGYPINSPAREGQLTVSADARYAYISSDRPGGLGESDLYKIELRDYAVLEKDGKRKTGSGLGILRGTIREGFEGYGIPDVDITVKDAANTVVASATTSETGEYFITLRSGKYTLLVSKKGYKDISESVEVPVSVSETPIVEKGYLLKK